MSPCLQLRDLGCEKGFASLFADINLSMDSGELLHVAGENGSGKTSLLKIIAGLNRQYSGDVLWAGENIRQCWPAYAPHILYLGHQPALKQQLTARENLRWYAAQTPGTDEERIAAALAGLGLRGKMDIPCHQLSAGQQRRAALARLLLSTHKLWILDEPFTALDSKGFAPVVQALRSHLARGGLALLTTHHGMENIPLAHRTLTLGNNAQGAAA